MNSTPRDFRRSRLLAAVAATLLLATSTVCGTPRAAAQEAETPTAKLSGGAWSPAGPAAAINGQPENIPSSPISGAIEAVVAHPTNPDVVWIGAVNGGVFRSDDATAASPRWTRLTDAQASLSIGALALDPTDGTHDTLVAGIGLTSSLASLGGPRSGLLRTTDGGASWTALSSMATRNISGVAPRGSIIVAAANNHDGCCSCAQLGIWRSTNTGATFTQISTGAGTGMPCGFSWDLASDPTDSTRLYTVATGLGGATDGIYRSTNTGATWTKVSNAAMDALLSAFPSNVHIAVGNAGGASANVFVAIVNGGQLSGLFRSGNAGTTWTSLDLPTTQEPAGSPLGIHPGGQGSIHLSLVADPTDHDVVYVGGDRQPSALEGTGGPGAGGFPNSIDASDFGGRLFRVDAGQAPGSQATPITNCPTASAACGLAVRTVNDTAPHADSRAMTFDAAGDLIETDDGGIYKHTDPSGSTGDWVSLIGNLPVNEQHDGAYDSISDILISGNQDNGTTFQITPGNLVWDQLLGGDGGDVVVAENDPIAGRSTRYVSAQNLGNLVRVVYDSNNVLQSFAFPTLTPLGGSPAVTPQFVTPLEVNAITPSRVLLGAANGLYESFDRLDSVTQIVTGGVNILAGGGPIAYGAAGDAGAFYFVGSQFVISNTVAFGFLVTDPDAGSTDLTAGVVMDPANASTAFAIDTDQVFHTTNGNTSWTDVTGNLQTMSPGTLRSIEYVPSASGDGIVVGATAGVFRALAPLYNTWDRLGSLPNVPVFELDYDPADDVLVASTLGRGAWTLHSASLQIHNLCNETFDLVTDQWKQIALACDPGGSNTVADVFGDDLAGTYDVDWVVWRHDAATQSNVKLATTDTLALGEGYWIKTRLAAQSVDVDSTVNAVTSVAVVTSTADPAAGCASSAGRCDMVGHPGTYEVCWADVQVIDGASTLSLSEADPAGACQGAAAAANGCVMSRLAHKWNGASYSPFDGQTLGMEGTLVPWDGFWVSAVKSGIQLQIPAVGGDCGAPKSATASGWFIRLTAESGDLVDANNVFGQLSDSSAGYDLHDLPELPPFGEVYLTVVFPHEDWADHAGDYASDYRAPGPESVSEVWRFEVRSSDPAAEVTLRWEGPSSRLAGSVLVDEGTGQKVEVDDAGSYSFTMTGASRSFRWILHEAAGLIFADDFESGDTNKW